MHRSANNIVFWRRLDKRNANSLLGYANYHSDNQTRAEASRVVAIQRKTTTAVAGEVKFFPSDRIWDLLFEGFALRGRQCSPLLYERLSLKDILITMLLHGGGLRESEPFHLYVSMSGLIRRTRTAPWCVSIIPSKGLLPPTISTLSLARLSGRRIARNTCACAGGCSRGICRRALQGRLEGFSIFSISARSTPWCIGSRHIGASSS